MRIVLQILANGSELQRRFQIPPKGGPSPVVTWVYVYFPLTRGHLQSFYFPLHLPSSLHVSPHMALFHNYGKTVRPLNPMVARLIIFPSNNHQLEDQTSTMSTSINISQRSAIKSLRNASKRTPTSSCG